MASLWNTTSRGACCLQSGRVSLSEKRNGLCSQRKKESGMFIVKVRIFFFVKQQKLWLTMTFWRWNSQRTAELRPGPDRVEFLGSGLWSSGCGASWYWNTQKTAAVLHRMKEIHLVSWSTTKTSETCHCSTCYTNISYLDKQLSVVCAFLFL